MQEYEVKVPIRGMAQYFIEADSESEAVKIAIDRAKTEKVHESVLIVSLDGSAILEVGPA